MKKFINELKRRNVIKASLAYMVISWIIVQVAQAVLPTFGAPDWVLKSLIIGLAIGLPIWIIISWIYDITPEGIEKTAKDSGSELVTQATNKRLNVFIIVSLSIAVVVLTLKLTDVFTDSDKQYSIAVLYFDNMSTDKENEYFCDGVTEDILTYLSKIKGLRVISRTSVKQYKNHTKTIPEIAKELGVDYIVEGSVRKYNDRVFITSQLINANDEHLWADNYDRNLDDVIAIQQYVAKEIAKELKIVLSPEEEEILKKYPTENMEAYQLVLKGRSLAESRNREDLESSIKLYQRAIELDPDYAEAYAEMAQSYFTLGYRGYSLDDSVGKAKIYVEKALSIDPNTFRAYAVRARIFDREEKWDKCKENFEKAIALNPNDAQVHSQYAIYFDELNDFDNSLIHKRKAQLLDPMRISYNNHLFNFLVGHDKIEEAEELFNKTRFLFTEDEENQLRRESYLKVIKNKDWTEAIRFFETKIENDPNNPYLYQFLGKAYDEILNDDINAIKNVKKAYEIDTTNSAHAGTYFNILVEGKKFKEAKKLFESNNFKTLHSEWQQLNHLWYYYYHMENYKKALEVLKDSLMMNQHYFKLLTYAQLGDRKKVDSLLINYVKYGAYKSYVYAIIKEKDSMYYYLEEWSIKGPNGRREFDPYRKEERYKALLKKNYLPITHWNE